MTESEIEALERRISERIQPCRCDERFLLQWLEDFKALLETNRDK